MWKKINLLWRLGWLNVPWISLESHSNWNMTSPTYFPSAYPRLRHIFDNLSSLCTFCIFNFRCLKIHFFKTILILKKCFAVSPFSHILVVALGLSSSGTWAYLPCGTWDLRSLTRDWTCVSCIGRRVPNHRTTWEDPKIYFCTHATISVGVQSRKEKPISHFNKENLIQRVS